MPYIDKIKRADAEFNPIAAGELNFAFCKLMMHYMDAKGKSYQTINDIIGAIEGAKAEFQRRVVAPYEDQKAKENGDVF